MSYSSQIATIFSGPSSSTNPPHNGLARITSSWWRDRGSNGPIFPADRQRCNRPTISSRRSRRRAACMISAPPAIVSSPPQSISPTNPTIAIPDFRSFGDAAPVGLAPSAYMTLAALLDQYMAARSCRDAAGACQISWTAWQQAWLGDKEFLTRPQC